MAAPLRRARKAVKTKGVSDRRTGKDRKSYPATKSKQIVDELANGLPADELPALVEWRNKNAKQIADAVKLLGPNSRNDAETALIEIEFLHRKMLSGFEPNKFAKKAVKKLLPALLRVEMLLKDKDLPTEFFLLRGGITKAIERCEKIAAAPPAKNPRKDAELKRRVIREAAALMSKHLGARSAVGAGTDALVNLAEVLHGGDVKLTSQVAAYVRESRKTK
ncbi:hypothetical protein [Bradyrhizobium diazoefficiens]